MMIPLIIGLCASLLASALLLDLRQVFYVDWNNHLWVMEYFGESIKHLNLPVMLNTQQLIGMPFALLYAQKFYVIAGTMSAFLGSAITIRILVILVLLLQFCQVYRSLIKAGSTQMISLGISVLVTWAIYPLTNLYNRNALPEFFAVALLTCSVASFLSVIIQAKNKVSRSEYIATGLFFVAAAVTHPLTAVFGGLFLGILGVITLFFCERARKQEFIIYFSLTALFALLVLSPWIYLVLQFDHKLPISSPSINAAYFHSQYFFPRSIDNILARLSPFPLDLKSTQMGVVDRDFFTPYIDAQVTLPLILLIGVFIYIGRRKNILNSKLGKGARAIVWGSGAMLVMVFTESICPKTFDWLGGVFNILQFPYRLVTYVNLAALSILIILASAIGQAAVKSKQIINICLAICIAVSFSALIEKLVHGAAIAQKSTKANKEIWAPLPFRSSSHLNELPPTFYGAGAFTVKEGFEKGILAGSFPYIFRNFNVLEGTHFGQVQGMTVQLDKPTLVVTNVQAFPWNQILVNGLAQSPYSIVSVGGQGAVLLPKGSYQLDYETRIDGIWSCLNFLSWVLLGGWVAFYIYSIIAFKEDDPWAVPT